MVSEIYSNINLDKVDCDINSILSDIRNVFECDKSTGINIDQPRVDQKQVAENLKNLMQVF